MQSGSFTKWRLSRQKIESYLYKQIAWIGEPIRIDCLISLSQIITNRIKIWKYVSVVTCREVIEYYETSYFGEYYFVLFEHICRDE